MGGWGSGRGGDGHQEEAGRSRGGKKISVEPICFLNYLILLSPSFINFKGMLEKKEKEEEEVEEEEEEEESYLVKIPT